MIKSQNGCRITKCRESLAVIVEAKIKFHFDVICYNINIKPHMQLVQGLWSNITKIQRNGYCTNAEFALNNIPSDEVHLKYGFPQGSCIGPFGFKLYTKPLTKIAKQHKINFHLYADDTQLYTTFKPEESEEAMEWIALSSVLRTYGKRMASHYLKLNDSKTEFMIFGSPHDTTKVTAWTVSVGDTEIFSSSSARNIGAFLDPELNMRSHINNTIRACYAQLRPVAQIRRYLTTEAASKLCHAFITSRLDNMNSLLYKLPDYQIHRLQLVQNNTARLIKNFKKELRIFRTL